MIHIKRDDRLGRRVSSSGHWKKVKSHVAGRRVSPSPLPVFREDEDEMSVDLLIADLRVHTRIADEEVGKKIKGWAILLMESLPDYELDARLTRDVDTNQYHTVVFHAGEESLGYTNMQFKADLTRCVTAWEKRVEGIQSSVE